MASKELPTRTLVMAAATIPIPVQRYSLPLTPFLILCAALGIGLPFVVVRNNRPSP